MWNKTSRRIGRFLNGKEFHQAKLKLKFLKLNKQKIIDKKVKIKVYGIILKLHNRGKLINLKMKNLWG